MLTVLHEGKSKTIVILARFRDDANSNLIFNQLVDIKEKDVSSFEKRITTILFDQIDNFYVNPSFWEKLSDSMQSEFISDLNTKRDLFPNRPIFEASLNIFDKKYAVGLG